MKSSVSEAMNFSKFSLFVQSPKFNFVFSKAYFFDLNQFFQNFYQVESQINVQFYVYLGPSSEMRASKCKKCEKAC